MHAHSLYWMPPISVWIESTIARISWAPLNLMMVLLYWKVRQQQSCIHLHYVFLFEWSYCYMLWKITIKNKNIKFVQHWLFKGSKILKNHVHWTCRLIINSMGQTKPIWYLMITEKCLKYKTMTCDPTVAFVQAYMQPSAINSLDIRAKGWGILAKCLKEYALPVFFSYQ